MARRKAASNNGEISKSQAVRDYLKEHPRAKPKVIRPAILEAHGLDVTPQMISMVKSKMKKTRRRGRKPGPKAGARQARGVNGGSSNLTYDQLIEVKRLADQLGGIERAREALDALARLS